MRGVGGPLLTISDLLTDIGDENSGDSPDLPPPSLSAGNVSNLPVSDLPKLFQENFDELTKALDGEDHSWTALTLKLCSALENANKLVDSTNSRVALLSGQVDELEKLVKRRDTAISAAKAIQDSHKL